jgi:hypothetical protein
LQVAFWRNFVCVTLALVLLASLTGIFLPQEAISEWTETPALSLAASVAGAFSLISMLVWQLTGLWRSAGANMGVDNRLWAGSVRVIAIGQVALVACCIPTAVTGLRSAAALVQMDCRNCARVEYQGAGVHLRGLLTSRVAKEAVRALENPSVATLYISGPGGMLWASRHIEAVVRRRHLTVVAGDRCISACTLILASGRRRAAFAGTLFGFHRAQSFYIWRSKRSSSDGEVENVLRQVGASEEFIARATGPQTGRQLYMPSLDEVISEGIVTDIIEGDHLTPASTWCRSHAEKCKGNRYGQGVTH